MDKLQRNFVVTIVNELIEPVKRNTNIDLKRLRKHLEESLGTLDEHRLKMGTF